MPSVTVHQTSDAPVRELRQLDERTQDRLRDIGAAVMPMHSLKRTGQRPLLFNGVTMATICGVTPALPFWYELNVHRTAIETYLCDIRLFYKRGDLPDVFRVSEHDDLDAAIAHLEGYDPAGDLSPPQELVRHTASPAELALATARLQLQVDQITQHYRALAGELLHALTPRS